MLSPRGAAYRIRPGRICFDVRKSRLEEGKVMPTQQFEGIVEILNSLPVIPPLRVTIVLDGERGSISANGDIIAGGVRLRSGAGTPPIPRGTGGQIELTNPSNQVTIWL